MFIAYLILIKINKSKEKRDLIVSATSSHPSTCENNLLIKTGKRADVISK